MYPQHLGVRGKGMRSSRLSLVIQSPRSAVNSVRPYLKKEGGTHTTEAAAVWYVLPEGVCLTCPNLLFLIPLKEIQALG